MIMRFYQKSLYKLFLKNAGIHISFFFSPTLQTLPALNHRAFKQNTHLLLSFFAEKKMFMMKPSLIKSYIYTLQGHISKQQVQIPHN